MTKCKVEFSVVVKPSSLLNYLMNDREWSLNRSGDRRDERESPAGKRYIESLFRRANIPQSVEFHPSRTHENGAVIIVPIDPDELEVHDSRLTQIIETDFEQSPTYEKKAILLAEELLSLENVLGNCGDVEILEINCYSLS